MKKITNTSFLLLGLQLILSAQAFAVPVPVKVTVVRPKIKQYFYPTATEGTYNLKEQITDKIHVQFEALEEHKTAYGFKKWSKKYTLDEAKAFPAQLIFKDGWQEQQMGRHRNYDHLPDQGDDLDQTVFVDTRINKMVSRKIFKAEKVELPEDCPEKHSLRNKTALKAENEHAKTGDVYDLFVRGFLSYKAKGKFIVVDPKTQVSPVLRDHKVPVFRIKPNGVAVVTYPAIKIEFYGYRDKDQSDDFYDGQIKSTQKTRFE